jgi:xanthine/CO dehydrogenase XdhC/CoxF family maturation factor
MTLDAAFLARINELIRTQSVFVLARIISSPANPTIGKRFLIPTDGTVLAELQDNAAPDNESELVATKARELLNSNAIRVHTLWHHSDGTWSNRKSESQLCVMFEIVRPQPELLICGGGHVGNATARLAAFLEYKTAVIDERSEFANRQILPDSRIDLINKPFDQALRDYVITSSTNIVIVTRGHAQDETCLKEIINSAAGYIGMIGSKRRVNAVFDRLVADGFSREATMRVHAPIGLRIGAQTPEEIAVSILAEIIAIQYGSLK